MRTLPTAACLALSAALSTGSVRAETFDTCTGFIASVPTTISTQGVWCMDRDLSSALASGVLITIATNNVTIDCNGYKLGGLAAGVGTQTHGIEGIERQNVTVRDCNIRGFKRGINLFGTVTAGHRIIGNRIESSTEAGMFVGGSGVHVAHNAVLDTGGVPGIAGTYAMYLAGDADVIDNRVDGVLPNGETNFGTYGIIVATAAGAVIRDNRIRGVVGGTSTAHGIGVYFGEFASIVGNDISFGEGGEVVAIHCAHPAIVTGNRIYDFGLPLEGCADDGGNIVKFVPAEP